MVIGDRIAALCIRFSFGCTALVPHVLWSLLFYLVVVKNRLYSAWCCVVLIHHALIYFDMTMFCKRRSKAHGERILIIGAGLSGIRCAAELLSHGYLPTILESSDSYGGTWNANDYPGCKSDIATSYYLFAKWFLHFRFRCCLHGYSTRNNSRWYAKTFAAYAGLGKLTRFNCTVRNLVPSKSGGYMVTWKNKASETLKSAHYDKVIFAIGVLNKPRMIAPASKHVVHASAMTAAQSLSLKGKSILIVGAACSGSQMVAPLVRDYGAESVTLCAPRGMWFSPCTMIEHTMKSVLDFWMQLLPLGPNVLRVWDRAYGVLLCEIMRAGKGMMWTRMCLAFGECYTRACYRMTQLDDLSPTHSYQGTRPVIDYDFFDALYFRQNVKFIKARVDKITQKEDGTEVQFSNPGPRTREFDFVIMATGFETDFTARLASLGLKADVAENFFGICIKDLPDCFFMYGPNTNSIGGSITDVMEIQSRAIVKLIGTPANIPDSWYSEFSNWIVQHSPAELTTCKSWYTNGSGRNLLNYPGSYSDYERRLAKYLFRLP